MDVAQDCKVQIEAKDRWCKDIFLQTGTVQLQQDKLFATQKVCYNILSPVLK